MRAMRMACLVIGLLLTAFAQAGPISVDDTRIENAYPEQIVFEIDVSSSAPIARAELHVTLQGDRSTTVILASFSPGNVTSARAVWKTRQEGVPPGAPYSYHWEIRDEAGASLATPAAEGLVVDPRRDWSALMDDQVAIWWYEGDAAFGQRIFDLAANSLSYLRRESGLAIPYQLRVVLYPDADAFAEWHEYVQAWVGGEAYTTMGLTVQIISPTDPWDWVQSVVCHEIAHLFFYQATHNAISMGPHTWIGEGYAQYHECGSKEASAGTVEDAVRHGQLIPLRLATGSFGGDDPRVRLLYAESWSAVAFLYDRWGSDGMARLMEAFRDGAESNDALRDATGLDFEEFQQAWWDWLGGPPDSYPTPPLSTAAETGAAPTLASGAATSTAIPAPAVTTSTPVPGISTWPCASGAAAALVGLAALLPASRSRRRRAIGRRGTS